MNPNLPSEKRRFAAAYLRCFDADAAAASIGRCDGIRLLETPAVQREMELQRSHPSPSFIGFYIAQRQDDKVRVTPVRG